MARIVARLPDAQTLDRIAYRTTIFAFPVFGFGVIFGAIWAEEAWGRYWGWDPKETVSFIAWVIYAAYLHARSTAGWRDKKAAWINVVGLRRDGVQPVLHQPGDRRACIRTLGSAEPTWDTAVRHPSNEKGLAVV